MRLRTAFAVFAVLLGTAASAYAGDPIMPLSQVKPGMKCKGYTVIRGTDITSFDVEVVDVFEQRPYAPAILVRVSGPAVANGGVAAGFSGSPIYCDDGSGPRNAGAIAEVVGDYGNNLALATSIEEILREPLFPPSPQARRLRAAAAARVPAPPLTVAGLSRPVERALVATARRGGRQVIAAPKAAGLAGPFEPLKPGSSAAVGLSSGDLWIGGVGTVAYVDGTTAWLFGHPFEGVGRRSLLLQQAYVYTVVGNPDPALGSYKLASPGADIGTVTNDGLAAVVGQMGTLPRTTDVQVTARDADSAYSQQTQVQVADESGVDLSAGYSPLSLVGPLAVADASSRALRSVPSRETGSMCVRITLVGEAQPLRICNRYVTQLAGGVGGGMADDVANAITAIDDAEYAPLSVERVDAELDLRRGAQQAYMLGATIPRSVRRGTAVTVSLRTRMLRGALRRFDFKLRIPSSLRPGEHVLTLSGPSADESGEIGGAVGDIIVLDGGGSGTAPARSFDELKSQIAKIGRWDGVVARFTGGGGSRIRAYLDPAVRIGGTLKLRLRVSG
ncbi:MAG: hypothetical protein QOE06_1983 [Thermoleophilaceae bacterium]|nr:hypothetical protein [Thermoleophilaceae bacterium]